MDFFNIKKLAVVTALGLSATAANAGVISYTDSWDFGTTGFSDTLDVEDNPGDGYSSRSAGDLLYFSRFDDSLGTLTGVELTFMSDWEFRGGIYVSDNEDQPGAQEFAMGDGSSSQTLRFTLEDPATAQETNYFIDHSACASAGNATEASCDDFESSSGNFDGQLDVAAIDLTDWISGPGDVVVRLINWSQAEVTGCHVTDSCQQWNFNNNWSGEAKITYTYADVPEPGTLSMLALGLIGLGASRLGKSR